MYLDYSAMIYVVHRDKKYGSDVFLCGKEQDNSGNYFENLGENI